MQLRWRSDRLPAVLEGLCRDARYALRLLERQPGFTAVCVLTLSLALGATFAVFALIHRIVLEPIDVPASAHLMTVQRGIASRGDRSRSTSLTWDQAAPILNMSSLERAAISSTALDRSSRRLAVAIDSRSVGHVDGRFVSAGYFRVLGLTPTVGRDFAVADDRLGSPPVAILSHRFWVAHFGGDAGVVGRTIQINQSHAVVIGVAPRGFTGTELGVEVPAVYLPLRSGSILGTDTGAHTDGRGRFFYGRFATAARSPISPVANLTVLARVTPGANAWAHAELAAVLGSGEWGLVPLRETMLPFGSRSDLRWFLGLLGGAVALTFLIGCANVCGLLLARSERRLPELAVRAALGARPARLLREVAVEAGILAAAGGAGALFVAAGVYQLLSPFVLPGGIAISSLRDGIDGWILAFGMLSTCLAAIACGSAPALRAARTPLVLHVRTQAGGSARLGSLRLIVAVQVTIGVLLVFGATLFVRTVANALAIDLGFDARGLMSASLSVPPTIQGGAFEATEALVAVARGIPGVSAATAGPLPIVRASDGSASAVVVDGAERRLSTPAEVVYTASDYFTTLRQPLVAGRDFADSDRPGARPVAIVNEAAARQFWPGLDGLGRELAFPVRRAPVADGLTFSVVGIVRDAKLRSLDETGRPVIYLARAQHPHYLSGRMSGAGASDLILRASRDAAGLAPALERAAARAGLSLQGLTTLEQRIDEILNPQRLGRALLLLLGSIALALTAIGVYGLASCLAVRQTREIGIRMALGAGSHRIGGALLRGTMLPVGLGILAGTAIAWAAGSLTNRFLYGLHGSDPATIGIAIALLLAIVGLAVLPPTRRALRIDPVATLRGE
jgi:predicted permease